MNFKKPDGRIKRIGRDEMNLAEMPFAKLDNEGKNTTENVIEENWEYFNDKTNRVVKASWRVSGDPVLGLPNSSDECIYLVFLELTKEKGMPQKVCFSGYEVLKRLGWNPNTKSYDRLKEGIMRIRNTNINAQNCFWDNKEGKYKSVGFSLINEYSIPSDDDIALENENGGKGEERKNNLTWSFQWSDQLYQSFQAGYIRSLDIGFAFSLRNPTARRLFRYLDKKSYLAKGKKRPKFEIGAELLCLKHLGMRKANFPSQYKQRLQKAHQELIERGFLLDATWETSRNGEAKIVYRYSNGKLKPVQKKIKSEKGSQTLDRIDLNYVCQIVFENLPETEQTRLLTAIRSQVVPDFWDRIQNPESPMGQEFWNSIEEEFPEEFQKCLKSPDIAAQIAAKKALNRV